VFAIEPVPAGIPDALLALAQRGDDDEALAAFIGRCGAIVTALPDAASVLYVPALVFDAAALGVPVVVPRPVGRGYLLPRICGVADSTAEAGALLTVALRDGEVSRGRRDAGRVSVRHEHTYAHRLATVASCFSHAVMPAAAPLPRP
jgi:hypothetical protein